MKSIKNIHRRYFQYLGVVGFAMSIVLGAADVAHADDQSTIYGQIMSQGLAFYKDGATNPTSYLRAIDSFQQARQYSRDPQPVYNIARSYQMSGNCPQALAHFIEYRSLASANAPNVSSAASYISSLNVQCGTDDTLAASTAAVRAQSLRIAEAARSHGVSSDGQSTTRLSVRSRMPVDGSEGDSDGYVRGDINDTKFGDRSLLIAGIITTALGTVMVGVGGYLTYDVFTYKGYTIENYHGYLSSGDEVYYKRDDDKYYAGISVLSIGAASLVTGIVLMITDTFLDASGYYDKPVVIEPTLAISPEQMSAGVSFTF